MGDQDVSLKIIVRMMFHREVISQAVQLDAGRPLTLHKSVITARPSWAWYKMMICQDGHSAIASSSRMRCSIKMPVFAWRGGDGHRKTIAENEAYFSMINDLDGGRNRRQKNVIYKNHDIAVSWLFGREYSKK